MTDIATASTGSDASEVSTLHGRGSQTFVSFLIDGQRFAITIEAVREIIRTPKVFTVPKSPTCFRGLANLRGVMLPVLDLRLLLGHPAAEETEQARVVVVDYGSLVGLTVDQISSVFSVDVSEIEPCGKSTSNISTEALAGAIRTGSGDDLVLILNVEKLIRSELYSAATDKSNRVSSSTDTLKASSKEYDIKNEAHQFVSFTADGQEYALPISDVEEIVRMPLQVNFVPNMRPEVIGLISLRSRLLPLVGLRRVLGLHESNLDEDHRIVVARSSGGPVGLVVDGVREVLRVEKHLIDNVPPLLSDSNHSDIIQSICRLGGGARLVNVLSTEALFDGCSENTVGDDLGSPGEKDAMAPTTTEISRGSDLKCVVFKLDQEEFAFGVEHVREIIRVPASLSKVPGVAEHVLGLVNLRGEILPVIDLRKRLGLPELLREDRQRIMVLALGPLLVGAVVDAVTGVLSVHPGAIEETPGLSRENGSQPFGTVINLHERNRLILRIDPEVLVNSGERELLSEHAA